MPTTRSQCQLADDKKTRASRKRKSKQLAAEYITYLAFHETFTEEPEVESGSRKRKVEKLDDGSSARARVYCRTEKKKQRLDLLGDLQQGEIQIVEEKVNRRHHQHQQSMKRSSGKQSWISHQNVPTLLSEPTEGNAGRLPGVKRSQEKLNEKSNEGPVVKKQIDGQEEDYRKSDEGIERRPSVDKQSQETEVIVEGQLSTPEPSEPMPAPDNQEVVEPLNISNQKQDTEHSSNGIQLPVDETSKEDSQKVAELHNEFGSQDNQNGVVGCEENCVGIGADAGKKDKGTKQKKKSDFRKIPRYLMDPKDFKNNPLEKERIGKSIYDKQRREVAKLKEENYKLKEMLVRAFWNQVPENSAVCVSIKPTLPRVVISKTKIPHSTQLDMDLALNPKLRLGVMDQQPKLSSPRAPLPEPQQPKVVSPGPEKPVAKEVVVPNNKPDEITALTLENLEKEKKCILNLYKQFANDNGDEDDEAIMAAIHQGKSKQCSINSLNAIVGKSKRKQTMTKRNINEDESIRKQIHGFGNDDEIQIIKEVVNHSGRCNVTSLKDKYLDVIFEEA